MKGFDGGAIVVTGAGSGIGRAIAFAFAEAGCDIVAADIDLETAEETALIVRQMGRRAAGYALDVSDASQVESFAQRLYAEWDDIDVLVNNAGVTLRPFRSIWEASEADWRWVMDVNFRGVLNGVRAFVPRMLARPGRKHIVNTSSVAPWLAIAGHGPYTASKGAVDGLSASLRSELAGSNIGLTQLVPGHVETDLATTERLRPAAEQCAHRTVTSFVQSDGERRSSDDHRELRQRLSETAGRTISPETVGRMLVDAVSANRPYCVTHPFRKEDLETLAGYLAGA